MLKLLLSRTVAIPIAVCAVVVAALSAQAGPAPRVQPPATDPLLAEIKGLRADLNQRLDASIRTQLLVARLQVQEQRITSLSRQLTDVQQQLQNSERGRAPLEAQLKAFEAAQENASAEEKKGAEFLFSMLRGQVEQMAKNDEELKRQQLYLSGLIAEEQSRWTSFNARLEELERLLTPAGPPRDR
jgi:septal ring factor EnvC (AmiA/AmiB activator)